MSTTRTFKKRWRDAYDDFERKNDELDLPIDLDFNQKLSMLDRKITIYSGHDPIAYKEIEELIPALQNRLKERMDAADEADKKARAEAAALLKEKSAGLKEKSAGEKKPKQASSWFDFFKVDCCKRDDKQTEITNSIGYKKIK